MRRVSKEIKVYRFWNEVETSEPDSPKICNASESSLQILGESGSEVSYFIPEPINFVKVARLSEDISKPWLKANLEDIKNLINN